MINYSKNRRNLFLVIFTIMQLIIVSCNVQDNQKVYRVVKEPCENNKDKHEWLHCVNGGKYPEIFYVTKISHTHETKKLPRSATYAGRYSQFFNNSTSQPISRNIVLKREVNNENKINYSELNRLSLGAETNVFTNLYLPNIEGSIERILNKESSINNIKKSTFTDSYNIKIKPKTKQIVYYKWKDIWENGVITLNIKIQNEREIIYKHLGLITNKSIDNVDADTRTIQIPYKRLIRTSLEIDSIRSKRI